MRKLIIIGLVMFGLATGGLYANKWERNKKVEASKIIETKARNLQKQIEEAFKGTYSIVCEKPIELGPRGCPDYLNDVVQQKYIGTGTLLPGGYVLTSAFSSDFEDLVGNVKFCISEDSKKRYELDKHYKLEKIISVFEDEGGVCYSLLKLKDDIKDSIDLPIYSYGLNTPKEIYEEMPSVTISYALGNKMCRFGEIKSDKGKHLTFEGIAMIPGDAGAPVYVADKEGNIHFTAIATGYKMLIANQTVAYGSKVEDIIANLNSKLDSGRLDKKTEGEIERFLKLNIKTLEKKTIKQIIEKLSEL